MNRADRRDQKRGETLVDPAWGHDLIRAEVVRRREQALDDAVDAFIADPEKAKFSDLLEAADREYLRSMVAMADLGALRFVVDAIKTSGHGERVWQRISAASAEIERQHSHLIGELVALTATRKRKTRPALDLAMRRVDEIEAELRALRARSRALWANLGLGDAA
jgi:hypothetical protein